MVNNEATYLSLDIVNALLPGNHKINIEKKYDGVVHYNRFSRWKGEGKAILYTHKTSSG